MSQDCREHTTAYTQLMNVRHVDKASAAEPRPRCCSASHLAGEKIVRDKHQPEFTSAS